MKNKVCRYLVKGAVLLASCLMLSLNAYAEDAEKTLAEAVQEKLGDEFIVGASIVNDDLRDSMVMDLVTTHHNAITLGNELKPDAMFNYSSSCPGTTTEILNGEEIVVPIMNYTRAEKTINWIKEWNEQHPEHIMKIRGHVLVWHSQTPEWFFHEDYDAKKPYVNPQVMDKRQEWYIKTMCEHFTGEDSPYHGMFYGWDVVNEAVSDNSGTYRSDKENSSWWAVYHNQDFIINAFKYANKYMDPSVQLYYNDYNEWYANKRKGIIQLIRDVKAAEGTRIDGFGMQGHYATTNDPGISDFITSAMEYAQEVDCVQVTELDLKASNAYHGGTEGLEEEYALQANRYSDLYKAMQELKEGGVNLTGMTLWGVIDPNSWLQTFHAVGGASDGRKTQVPLLFDGAYQKKPAFYAFVNPGQIADTKKSIQVSHVDDGGGLSGCLEYHMNCSGGDITVIPSWKEKGIGFKVTVSDKQKTEGDKVTVYVKRNGTEKVLTAEKTREQGITNGSGYDVVLFVKYEEELAAGDEFAFEIAVQNRGEVSTFSGKVLDGEPSDENFSDCILR